MESFPQKKYQESNRVNPTSVDYSHAQKLVGLAIRYTTNISYSPASGHIVFTATISYSPTRLLLLGMFIRPSRSNSITGKDETGEWAEWNGWCNSTDGKLKIHFFCLFKHKLFLLQWLSYKIFFFFTFLFQLIFSSMFLILLYTFRFVQCILLFLFYFV